MSSASPFRSDFAAASRQQTVEALHRTVLPVIRFAGFWTAILVPFVLLAFVAAGVVAQYPLVAGGLLVGNVAGLVLGRNYNR